MEGWVPLNRTGRKANISLLLFCAPALAFFAVFMFYPLISAFYYSTTDWNGVFRTYHMVGLRNYIEAFTKDARFHYALGYTFRYVVTIVILENVLGLLIALLVESRLRSKGVFRTLFFMPNILSVYIGSLMWLFIFTRVFPQISAQTILTFLNQSWIGDKNMAFISILMVALWNGTGYLMIIYIAAIQGVSPELLEAAVIDGAGGFQRFRHIVLPLLMPAVTVCLFLTLNGSFKIFDSVVALTKGGPGYATEVVALNIYYEGFTDNMRFGYATAKSIILFFIILVITVIQVTATKSQEVEM
jgi:raffinose/stachyose/melibiose transport system permease protein